MKEKTNKPTLNFDDNEKAIETINFLIEDFKLYFIAMTIQLIMLLIYMTLFIGY